eukprot:maker-scaffold_3-snap-gene-12.12-mRNA-1 protein AED:0.00 eAED:0.00 QI:31/1/1/1/1/1/2/147/326
MKELSIVEEEWKTRLERFYNKYQPDKVGSIEPLLKKVNGNPKNFENLIQQLIKKYGEEPIDETLDSEEEEDRSYSEAENEVEEDPEYENKSIFKTQLKDFYTLYNPTKLSKVDDLVARVKNNPRYERRVMKMLHMKYAEKIALSQDSSSLLKQVEYCPVDGLPAEYCEYLPTFKETLPWLLENYPTLILQTQNDLTVQEFCETGDSETLQTKSKRGGARPNKNLTKGKVKEGSIITIETASRGKRKYVTSVVGLDLFGVKLKEAGKKLGKRFACSASVIKTKEGKSSIDIQGDVSYDLPQILVDFFEEVSPEVIYFLEKKKKTKAF